MFLIPETVADYNRRLQQLSNRTTGFEVLSGHAILHPSVSTFVVTAAQKGASVMRGWTKTHLYAGIAITLVVVIGGCCLLSLVGGVGPRPAAEYSRWPGGWMPMTQPWGLLGRLIQWVFGLLGLVVYTVVVVLVTLWAVGRTPRFLRRGGNQ